VPLNLPTNKGKVVIDCFAKESGAADFGDVAEAHTAVIEAVVGADEALMEKYLGGELTAQEAESTAARAVAEGAFMPILFANPKGDVGVAEFLSSLKSFCPSPKTGLKRTLVTAESKTPITPDPAGPFIGQVFKITSDPKSNIKYLSVRVHSGTLTSDMQIKTVRETRGARPGHVMRALGADHKDIESGMAGDIIALAKLDYHIGEVIFTTKGGTIDMPAFPEPMLSLALESKSRGDEDKISVALKRFADEDPCFRSERGTGGELVVRGMGELQMRTYIHRMSKHYKLDVETKPPRIPYRETVTTAARDIEYTHKKQTGGAGQFGRVVINVLPAARGEGYESSSIRRFGPAWTRVSEHRWPKVCWPATRWWTLRSS
jgi:elongation factor G